MGKEVYRKLFERLDRVRGLLIEIRNDLSGKEITIYHNLIVASRNVSKAQMKLNRLGYE